MNFPGISYSTENQKKYLDVLLNHFSEKQLRKLLNVIALEENDYIIQFERIDVTLLNLLYFEFIPEYKTHIITKFKNKGYYNDYKNKKLISLDSEKNINFEPFFEKAEFYAISFATLNEKNNILINFINKIQQ